MSAVWLLALGIASLSWDVPTENVDGSELTDLAGFNVYVGTASRDYADPIELDDPAQISIELMLPAGRTYFAMTALDEDGNESAFSNEVTKVIVDDSPPLPPVVLLDDEVVFTVIKQPDRFVLLPLGTVPAGTLCDPNHSVNGLGVVPTAAVVWTSATGSRPLVVVARCDG